MINGKTLRDAFISAANHITANRQTVDELNVFPVPDGDTGTNMSMSISAAARELSLLTELDPGVDKIADTAASALLRGARGNSGVILSLLFRGFARALKGINEMSGANLADALASGVDSAYKAVMKPTEGTILTVSRVAAETAKEALRETDDVIAVFEAAIDGGRQALAQTPELLPILKKAGVVDAGGQGLIYIYDAMLAVFRGGDIISSGAAEAVRPKAEAGGRNVSAEFEGEITFTYCTEFIVKRNPGCVINPLKLRAALESIGDSVVVVDDERIIKVHVHTDSPNKALGNGLKFGQLINIKIDNMRDQHEQAAAENARAKAAEAGGAVEDDSAVTVPAAPEKQYGFVSVAAGAGLQELFHDLGADKIVNGGQTMNPCTEDILKAIEETPSEVVFVLPNNKNIIMAAEQAIPLSQKQVFVLHTHSIPMGMAAMLAFDPDISPEENVMAMREASLGVGTGQITFAARDSDFDNKKIKEGEILALENGRLSFTETNIINAAFKLVRSLYKKDSSFITLIYGEGVTQEQADALAQAIRPKVSKETEIAVVYGGQPVYYFIISVE